MKFTIILILISNPKFEVSVQCDQMVDCFTELHQMWENDVPRSFPHWTSKEWEKKLFLPKED